MPSYTVLVETEDGKIEKPFPSRERAELFACFVAAHGLEGVVIDEREDGVADDGESRSHLLIARPGGDR